MHIPDAFMPIPQGIIYWAIALVFIALSLRWVRQEMDETKVPLVAILAAGIFVIQAFNLPVALGPAATWWAGRSPPSCWAPPLPRSSSSPWS